MYMYVCIYVVSSKCIATAIDKDLIRNLNSLTKASDDTNNNTKYFSGKSLSRTEKTRRRDKDRDEKVTTDERKRQRMWHYAR